MKEYSEKEIAELKNEEWRKGYELGVKVTLKDNSQAIKLGEAIISVLDNRYEFQKEDY